jgi:DNA-binding response OmpR family regulator
MPSDIRQALDAGFDDYIVKPFAVDALLTVLDRFDAASLARHSLD